MNAPVIEWGYAGRPLPGETESGDRCVARVANGRAMIAVIDGLGHGSEAAIASQAAVDILERDPDDGIGVLFQRCHARLQRTRGAAMTMARYDAATRRIQWLGAGNVRAILLRSKADGAPEYRDMLVYSGTVGVRLSTIEVLSLYAQKGDVLILASDGIRDNFAAAIRQDEDPKAQAERLLASHWIRTDDAMILVARIN